MADEVDNTTPARQAYLAVSSDSDLKGRFSANTTNIRLFKSNPYIKDLPEADVLELNKSLLEPYQGEQFYDDDLYVYTCNIVKNALTGETEYKYVSKEKENAAILAKYQSTGIQNQLMSAYNNGRVYNFYVDRGNLMMYPNSTLVFPSTYAFYTVRKQELNKNKEYVYVAGTLEDGSLADMHIAMKTVVDTANNTTYTRMSPSTVFEVANASDTARFDQIVSGEFYVVEFYNSDGFLIDTKLFQAQDALITDTALPSKSVQSIRVSVIRAGITQTSANGVYPILAGEDIENSISYSIRAVYNDGTIKDITDKLDTAWLARSWENKTVDTTSATVGDQFTCDFSYFPNLDEEKNFIGNAVESKVTFQVIENSTDKIYKIIPVIWYANTSNYTGDGVANAKIYNLKVYKMSTDGVITNCSRAFYNTFKYKNPSTGNLVEFTDCPNSYDPYNQCMTFVWQPTNTATTYEFDFKLWNSGVLNSYRFQAKFGDNEADIAGNYVRALTSTTFGYEVDGPLYTLKETYGTKLDASNKNVLQNTATVSIKNAAWLFEIASYTEEAFATRYKRTVNGSLYKANAIQLFAVKDETYTALTRLFTFGTSDTKLIIPAVNNESVITSIIENMKTYDWILAKFYNSEVGSGDILLGFDVFAANKIQ